MKVSFDEEHAISRLREYSIPFQKENDIQALVDHVGNSQIVLLGEASHGTHEYYTWRSLITKKLIREKGFRFIAVEGDWPDCYQLNRYIKNYSFAGKTSYEVLEQFNRWPT
ncbi:MAG TPA: erythromycin esterase family protein, partial [Flavisolibacter sp.]